MTDPEVKSENNNADAAQKNDALVAAVAERLDFFFSDANLRSDRFLQRELMKKPENEGRVGVSTLLKFNSIQKLVKDVPSEEEGEEEKEGESSNSNSNTQEKILVQAAKTLQETLQLNDDETMIGRVVAFTQEMMDGNIPKSLYIKNLPMITEKKEGDDSGAVVPRYDVTIDELRDLVKQYGKVDLVKLRFGSWPDGQQGPNNRRGGYPLGGAFVEFAKEEDLKAAAADLCVPSSTSEEGEEKKEEAATTNKEEAETGEGEAAEPKRKLELKGETLKVVRMADWLAKKKAKNGDRKRKADKIEKEETKEEEKEPPKEYKMDWKPKCVIRVEGFPKEGCSREDIRKPLATWLGVSEEAFSKEGIYIDYSRGQADGAIRFNEPSDKVQELCDKLVAGDIQIQDTKVQAKILEGEEEQEYWKKFIDFKTKQLQVRENEKRSKRGRFRRN